jgi:hypothetical protein
MIPDWKQITDCYLGQRVIKENTVYYLPETAGMVADGFPHAGTKGTATYNAYIYRARFPDQVKDAIKGMLGVMHQKPAVIELPEQMEYLRDAATPRNETLQQLLQRINLHQLRLGRVGLLADVLDAGPRDGDLYIALYFGDTITNWNEGARTGTEFEQLRMVTLNETSEVLTGEFTWQVIQKYRVLSLGDSLDPTADVDGATYHVGVATQEEGGEFSGVDLEEQMVKGRTCPMIPFVFINPSDITADPDQPPLMGLSNLSLAMYRRDADYSQSLYLQSQDTLVTKGGLEGDVTGQDSVRVGVGAHIKIIAPQGDAKFIGVDSKGLPEQRLALENDSNRAEQIAGQLLQSVSRERESGDALRVRVATRTATLNEVAAAGAFGLQTLLRKMAVWLGADPEAVTVAPNLDFVDDQMSGRELVDLTEAKKAGAPISYLSLHSNMADRGMTKMSFEDEIKRIEEEDAAGLPELLADPVAVEAATAADPATPADEPPGEPSSTTGTT